MTRSIIYLVRDVDELPNASSTPLRKQHAARQTAMKEFQKH